MRRSEAGLSWVVAILLPIPAWGQVTVPILQGDRSVRVEIAATGLGGFAGDDFQIAPTEVIPDGSGRLFVATLGGVVRVYDPGVGLLPTPYLTQTQTNTTPASNGEWGMTGLAFHPDYRNQGADGYGKFYSITTEPADANGGVVDFSFASDHQDVVKEWTATDPNANVFSGSVREVMRVGQPGEPHNVFDLAFGPEGYLYLSSGDGGFGNEQRVQDLGSVHGKVLRIDPLDPSLSDATRGVVSANGAYRVPETNPFFDQVDALGEVWALGFRSPYRMNFDRQTGELYVGDVGAGQREEVSLVEAGGNYGWPIFEGTRPSRGREGFTPPLYEYTHADGLSVIGGFVYRGTAIPELRGTYVFADLGQGRPTARLLYADPETGEVFDFQIDAGGDTFLGQLGPEAGTELSLPERIIGIGEDEEGELYLAAVGVDPRQGGGVDGMLIRITAPVLSGDYSEDGIVDAADYTLWRDGLGAEFNEADYSAWEANFGASRFPAGDFNRDGVVEAADYTVWRDLLGTRYLPSDYDHWVDGFNESNSVSVPEPNALLGGLVTSGVAIVARVNRRRAFRTARRAV